MKSFLALSALMLMCGGAASAKIKMRAGELRVKVYLKAGGVPLSGLVVSMAEDRADRLFQAEGIRLEWFDGRAPAEDSDPDCVGVPVVAIRFVPVAPSKLDTPEGLRVLAEAQPYGKYPLEVTVFGDRVATYLTPFSETEAGKVLGHVLAHEIAHVLQGVSRHSDKGLMKARWTWQDLILIRGMGLKFEDADRILLRGRFEAGGRR